MKVGMKTRIIKQIKIDINKCIGCRACELACSAFHSIPKYSKINPANSRIRVLVDELKDSYVPIRAGDYTSVECNGRHNYIIDGKEYRECSFCKAACPSRGYFKDPDTGLPLRCDMCESDPPLEKPWCVKVCGSDALTYQEREQEMIYNEKHRDEIEIGLEALADKYGIQSLVKAIARKSKRNL